MEGGFSDEEAVSSEAPEGEGGGAPEGGATGSAGVESESEGGSSVEVVLPPPAPRPEATNRPRRRGGTAAIAMSECWAAGRSERTGVHEIGDVGDVGRQSLRTLEQAFWKCFGDKVSEWNPCFSAEGQERFSFHGDVDAHNVEVDLEDDLVKKQPSRVNLRALLDDLFADEAHGSPSPAAPCWILGAGVWTS